MCKSPYLSIILNQAEGNSFHGISYGLRSDWVPKKFREHLSRSSYRVCGEVSPGIIETYVSRLTKGGPEASAHFAAPFVVAKAKSFYGPNTRHVLLHSTIQVRRLILFGSVRQGSLLPIARILCLSDD